MEMRAASEYHQIGDVYCGSCIDDTGTLGFSWTDFVNALVSTLLHQHLLPAEVCMDIKYQYVAVSISMEYLRSKNSQQDVISIPKFNSLSNGDEILSKLFTGNVTFFKILAKFP
jgi:hypothetical protein